MNEQQIIEGLLELAVFGITALIGLSSACIVWCSFEATKDRRRVQRIVSEKYPRTY